MSTQFTNRQWRLPNNENKNKQSNYSMDFDGSSYITTSVNPSNYSALTVSSWINFDSTTGRQSVFSQYQDNTNNVSSMWMLWNVVSNELWFFIIDSSNAFKTAKWTSSNSFTLTTGNWYNVVGIWDGSYVKIYVNGEVGSYSDAATSLNSSSLDFLIGSGMTSGGAIPYDEFNGKIDGVAIFDYALPATGTNSVATLYGSSSTGIGNPMSLSPKPVAYYPLGDQDAFNGADYLVPNSSLKDYVFDFVANGDTVSIPDSNELDLSGTDFSISFWVNANDISSSQMILQKYSGTSGWAIYNQSGKNTLDFYQAGSFFALDTNSIDNNIWSHYVVTANVSSSEYKIYKNGSLINTISRTVNITSSTQPLYIGSLGGTGFYYNGLLSNVSILNTTLPATGSNSVETIYNNGSPLTSMSGFTSLQGWWKLDASATYDSSTTTWTIPDDSTNSNTGTSSGMTQANLVQSDLSFTSGYSPYALQLDGTDDYINCGHINLTGAFSLSFWTKYTTTSVVNVITQNNSGEATFGMYQLTDGKIRFWVTSSGSYNASNEITANTATNNGNWNNIILINDGTNLKIYINGSLDNSSSNGVSSPYNGTANFWIGGVEAGGSTFNGSISNVSVWNAGLTSSQVSEIYNEGVPSNLNNHSAYSNLVSWWQLGSNSSFNTNWTVLNEISTGPNGTSSNMTEADIVDGVGSYANGLSSGMGGDEVIGDAPYSTANSLSVNMDVLDRVTDTPS